MRFSLPSIKCSPALPSFRLLPSARWSNRCAEFRQRTEFGSSRKLGGPAEHLIDSSEKLICRLSFLILESACYWKVQLNSSLRLGSETCDGSATTAARILTMLGPFKILACAQIQQPLALAFKFKPVLRIVSHVTKTSLVVKERERMRDRKVFGSRQRSLSSRFILHRRERPLLAGKWIKHIII